MSKRERHQHGRLVMQPRRLILLAAAAAVAVTLAIAAVATGDRYVSPVRGEARAFPALAGELAEVASVGVEKKGFALTLRRRGEDWLVAQKDDYPADAGKVGQLVLTLADMRLVEPKTRLPDLYPRLEVADPGTGGGTLVALADVAGKPLARLIVGKRQFDRLGEGRAAVYVRRPGDTQSWLASGGLDLPGDVDGWLDRRIADIGDSRIAEVNLIAPDGSRLSLRRAKPDDRFAVVGAPPDTKFKSDTATNQPAMALDALIFDDVAPAAKLPAPANGLATASYTTFDGLTVDLRLFAHDKKDWISVAATGTGKAAAEAKRITERVKGWSYSIPDYKAAMIRTKLADLVAPQKGS
jgi:hypothetical protein